MRAAVALALLLGAGCRVGSPDPVSAEIDSRLQRPHSGLRLSFGFFSYVSGGYEPEFALWQDGVAWRCEFTGPDAPRCVHGLISKDERTALAQEVAECGMLDGPDDGITVTPDEPRSSISHPRVAFITERRRGTGPLRSRTHESPRADGSVACTRELIVQDLIRNPAPCALHGSNHLPCCGEGLGVQPRTSCRESQLDREREAGISLELQP